MKAGDVFLKKILSFLLAFCFSSAVFAEKDLIPGGNLIGISIMTDGLLVADTAELTGFDGRKTNPAKKAGIKSGDRIMSVDGNRITSNEQFINYVKNQSSDMVLTLKRNFETLNTVISPVRCDDGYKLGILIKDSCAGLGTLTFIDPENGKFGALGHSISDNDTNTLIICREGKIMSCNASAPIKGKKGSPGALNGNIGSEEYGTFTKNSENGIFGTASYFDKNKKTLKSADFSEIFPGKATILSDVDGLGVKEYSIKIKKVAYGRLNGKNIEFSVTDKELISKTGGIVCGMSGSPIIQNDKIIGAVTHVLVNDPTKGYGILIENMLSET